MKSQLRNVLSILTIVFATVVAGAASAADVLIQSDWSGSFVRLQRGMLHANANPDQAARFEMIRLNGDRVAFRAQDGSFVRAGIGRRTQLGSGSPHIRGWETFELVRNGRHSALRSVQNGKFVEVDARSGALSATALHAEGRASIRVINAPSRNPGAGGNRPRPPRVDWTGRWSQMWLASPNGNLHRPPSGARADFTISVDRQVEMTAGCNRVSARLMINGTRARFNSVFTTRMRCSNAEDGYERGMTRAMSRVRSYEYREGQVAFLDGNGRALIQIGR